MWHLWFMGLAAPIFAGKSHPGQKSSLSSSKCTQSWQKLLSAPQHTWKSLTLLSSTEAAISVIFKTQINHLPPKKSQEVKCSNQGDFSLPHWVQCRTLDFCWLYSWHSFRFGGTGRAGTNSFPSVLGKHDFTPKANTRPLLNLALSEKKNAQPEEMKTPGFTSHWF